MYMACHCAVNACLLQYNAKYYNHQSTQPDPTPVVCSPSRGFILFLLSHSYDNGLGGTDNKVFNSSFCVKYDQFQTHGCTKYSTYLHINNCSFPVLKLPIGVHFSSFSLALLSSIFLQTICHIHIVPDFNHVFSSISQ